MIKSKLLNGFIAGVWLWFGLYSKVLNGVPRQQLIVGRILGETHAILLTKTIGILEIGMAIWVLSRIKPRWCAMLQIVLVGTMNTLEFFVIPDLLLFGRLNLVIALLFMALVYYNMPPRETE